MHIVAFGLPFEVLLKKYRTEKPLPAAVGGHEGSSCKGLFSYFLLVCLADRVECWKGAGVPSPTGHGPSLQSLPRHKSHQWTPGSVSVLLGSCSLCLQREGWLLSTESSSLSAVRWAVNLFVCSSAAVCGGTEVFQSV